MGAITGLDSLPDELMEHLLKFCDGKSLIALGSVCQRWNNFILKQSAFMQKKWGKVCTEEIPTDFILDILQTLYPKYWLNDQNILWSDVYISWYFWRSSSNLEFEILKLGSFGSSITSVLFSGDWILVGTREVGSLQAVNYKSLEARILYNRCDDIKNMYLRTTPNSVTGSDHLINGVEHEEIVLQFKREATSFNLLTGEVKEFRHLRNLTQLRYYEGQEVKIVNQLYSSAITSTDTVSGRLSKVFSENSVSSLLQVWNGCILLMFYPGQLQLYDFKLRPLEEYPVNTITKLLEQIFFNKRIHYVWHLDVIIILGPLLYADSWFEIYVKGKVKKYFPFQDISAMVTSALYHAGIIFFGTDLGDVLIYKVDSDDELLELNLSHPLYKLVVTEDEILSLAISATPSGQPLVAVGSANDLFLIRFN